MYSLSLENFDKCCRWCLTFAGEKNPILQSCLDTMLYAITSLKVLPDDGYPQLACRSCVMKLSAAYNFRQMTVHNYEKLTNIIKAAQQKRLEQQIQDVHIMDNIITEADSDHESYAMSAINMKVVETLDDDVPAVRDKEGRGWNTGQSTIPVFRLAPTPESRSEINPLVSDCDITEDVTVINADSFLKCRHCPAKFNSIDERRTHTLTHSERCKLCNKVVKRQNTVRHARTHTQDRRYACRECDRRFHDPTNRNKHERIHSAVDACAQKKYLCNYCGKKYIWRTSLCRHLRNHTAQSLVCAVCQLQFTDLSSWRKHKRTHEPLEYFSCPECTSSKFASRRSLNNHMRIMHATRRPTFSCAQCYKVYRDKASLRRHRALHLRPIIKCQLCDKTFANNRSLTRHLTVHEINIPTT